MPAPMFDPESLPVASIAGEAAIDVDRLTPNALRRRFAAASSWQAEFADRSVGDHEQSISETLLDMPTLSKPVLASVLLPIVLHDAVPTLLFTRRTIHLSKHPGQVSFPGGRAEDFDSSAIDTALRETEEEIGLDRRHVEVLGQLPDYVTATGYRVTPVVALVHLPFELCADPGEVAEVFEVPLRFLMNGLNHQRRVFDQPTGQGAARMFYAMPYERFFIWGATAGMLRNLFHFLRA